MLRALISFPQSKCEKLHLAGKSQCQDFPRAQAALCPPPAGDGLLSHMLDHLPLTETGQSGVGTAAPWIDAPRCPLAPGLPLSRKVAAVPWKLLPGWAPPDPPHPHHPAMEQEQASRLC